MKALINHSSIAEQHTNSTIQFASDGKTPYTGIAPHQITLVTTANDVQRG